MRGLWLQDGRIFFRSDLPLPQPGPAEALIRVRKAGICGTDLQLLGGYYDYTGIPGHEFVGEIVEAADAPQRSGERVVGEINVSCGQCRSCRQGIRTHCENRTVLGIANRNGAFAEYLILPLENLHTVPESLDDDTAVFAEPLAAALEITEQVSVPPGARVLLIGAGRLGQLIARTLSMNECRLFVAVRYPGQKSLLEGLDLTVVEESELSKKSMDLVIEATGSEVGLRTALRTIRPRGTVVLKSTFKGSARLDISSVVVDEITIVGSRCGPFEPALRLLAEGKIDPLPLISCRFPLSRGVEAFEQAASPAGLKVLLEVANPDNRN